MLITLLTASLWASGARSPCERRLRREQRVTQETKDLRRTLAAYDLYLFGWNIYGSGRRYRRVLTEYAGPHRPRLVDLLDARARRLGRPLRWTDAGAGFAIPMRQVAREYPLLAARLRLTAVDLFDWSRTRHRSGETTLLAEVGEDILRPALKPRVRLGDVATAVPPGQDLITSVEVMQYLPDKVAALAHWYNQLADGGVLLISTEHPFSREMRVDEPVHSPANERVLESVVIELAAAGIEVGTVGEWPEVRALAVRKAPGTRVIPLARPCRWWRNSYRYVFAYYPDEAFVRVDRDLFVK